MSRKVLIVEGVDKAGKTTLINTLAKKYPGYLIKVTYRPKDDSDAGREEIKKKYQKQAKWIVEEANTNFVLDRSFISELVYSKVMRGYDATDDPFFLGLENQLKSAGAILLYCDPGYSVLKQRHAIEKDDYIGFKHVFDLSKGYKDFLDNTVLEKYVVDTSRPIDEIIKDLTKRI